MIIGHWNNGLKPHVQLEPRGFLEGFFEGVPHGVPRLQELGPKGKNFAVE